MKRVTAKKTSVAATRTKRKASHASKKQAKKNVRARNASKKGPTKADQAREAASGGGASSVTVGSDRRVKVAKAEKESKPKRMTALDAAVAVLQKAGKPMHSKELIAAMAEQGLWTSPAGATPWATLYASMVREEREKGNASRFRKVDRGLFALNVKGK